MSPVKSTADPTSSTATDPGCLVQPKYRTWIVRPPALIVWLPSISRVGHATRVAASASVSALAFTSATQASQCSCMKAAVSRCASTGMPRPLNAELPRTWSGLACVSIASTTGRSVKRATAASSAAPCSALLPVFTTTTPLGPTSTPRLATAPRFTVEAVSSAPRCTYTPGASSCRGP